MRRGAFSPGGARPVRAPRPRTPEGAARARSIAPDGARSPGPDLAHDLGAQRLQIRGQVLGREAGVDLPRHALEAELPARVRFAVFDAWLRGQDGPSELSD